MLPSIQVLLESLPPDVVPQISIPCCDQRNMPHTPSHGEPCGRSSSASGSQCHSRHSHSGLDTGLQKDGLPKHGTRNDAGSPTQKRKFSTANQSAKASLNAHNWGGGRFAHDIEVASAPHRAHSRYASAEYHFPCEVSKQSDISSSLKTTAKSKISRRSPSLVTQDKKKAAQDAHAIMERLRRQEIGERTKALGTLLGIDGTKVEILTRAVEWIDVAKSRIAEQDLEATHLRSQNQALLERNREPSGARRTSIMHTAEPSISSHEHYHDMTIAQWSMDESASRWVLIGKATSEH